GSGRDARADAIAQLRRRRPREGDDDDLVDRELRLQQQAQHDRGDRVRLARPSAGLDELRPAQGQREGIERLHGPCPSTASGASSSAPSRSGSYTLRLSSVKPRDTPSWPLEIVSRSGLRPRKTQLTWRSAPSAPFQGLGSCRSRSRALTIRSASSPALALRSRSAQVRDRAGKNGKGAPSPARYSSTRSVSSSRARSTGRAANRRTRTPSSSPRPSTKVSRRGTPAAQPAT